MVNNDTLTTCFILFNNFRSKWDITLSQMGSLVEKYSLATFISKNEDDIHEFGVDGAVKMIENYIQGQGGVLIHGAIS